MYENLPESSLAVYNQVKEGYTVNRRIVKRVDFSGLTEQRSQSDLSDNRRQ